MKRLFLFWIVVLLSIGVWPQNVRYDSQVYGPKGAISSASIAVCAQPANTGNEPCTPLATLCSSLTDATCNQPNPVTSDSLGNFHFYVKQSELPVTVQIFGQQVARPFVMTDQLAPTGTSSAGTGSCTNQVVVSINSSAPPTCATVNSAFVDTSIAKTGADINTSNQVTSLHITGGTANAVPKFNGSGNPVPSALSDNGSTVNTSESITLPNGTAVTDTAAGRVTAGSNTLEETGTTTFYSNDNATGMTAGEGSAVSNAVHVWGLAIPNTITVAAFCWDITTADNTGNSYDIGLYNLSGTLVVHTGATSGTTFAPNNGQHCANASATTTVTPASYYLALTTNCTATCAALGGPGTYPNFIGNVTVTQTSSGGVLPSSITPPANSWGTFNVGEPWVLLHQ